MAKNLIRTPKGIAQYPHLNSPDTKYVAEGEYHVKLAIPREDANGLMATLDELYKASQEEAKKELKGKKPKAGSPPYTVDEETGECLINFKQKAQIKGKDGPVQMKIAIFDARGKPLTGAATPKIGGGSSLKISFEPSAYYTGALGAGVSLRLKAVQVIDLKEYGGGNASSYGFEEEEGFESTADATPATEASNDTAADTEEAAPSDGADF